MNARFLLLFAVTVTTLYADDSPQNRRDTPLTRFFATVHPGMTEKSFDRVLDRFQFRDGLAFLPVIISIHDTSRHFHIPGHGVYAFYFDRDRHLTAWKAWEQDAATSFRHSGGVGSATLTISEDSTSKPK